MNGVQVDVAAILATHRWRDPRQWGYGPSECEGCDWSGDWKDQGELHEAHLAQIIAALLVDARPARSPFSTCCIKVGTDECQCPNPTPRWKP